MSGINRVGIPSLNRMRFKNVNSSYNYGRVNNSRNNKQDIYRKNFMGNDYSERMRMLNNLVGLNAVRVTNQSKGGSLSKGAEVLSVSMDGEKKLHDKIVNLKVLNVAKPQNNTSVELFSKSRDIKAGNYEFEITSKGKSYISKVQVKEGQSNEEVLNAISLSVNSLNCGIKADVAKNKIGAVSLHLVSNETGINGSFKVKDSREDLMAKLKLNAPNQLAQNAEYVMNNKIYESLTNEISVENGLVKLKLNSEGTYNIDINKKRCYEAIQNNSNDIISNLDYLVNHYNTKIGNTPRNTFTYDKLTKELRNRESLFNNVGIKALNDNSMKFQDKHFRQLARANPQAIMSSMLSSNGVLNFFNMVKSSDLNRQSSLYGARGNNIGVFSRGSLLNY